MRDMTTDKVGAEKWKRTPHRYRIPGGIMLTTAQVFYPATGLLEERITLEEVSRDTTLARRQ